jgi:hypothetical protein
VDWVHGWWTPTGSHGPLWTGGDVDRRVLGHSGALIEGGPLTTPGRGSSPARAGNGEQSTGVPFWA